MNGERKTTRMSLTEMQVHTEIRLHHRGAANAITAAKLADIIGIPEREVRDIIRSLRVAHDCGEIVSSTGGNALGYWWSNSVEEIEACAAGVLSRRDELTHLLAAFHHARERLDPKPPQQVLGI